MVVVNMVIVVDIVLKQPTSPDSRLKAWMLAVEVERKKQDKAANHKQPAPVGATSGGDPASLGGAAASSMAPPKQSPKAPAPVVVPKGPSPEKVVGKKPVLDTAEQSRVVYSHILFGDQVYPVQFLSSTKTAMKYMGAAIPNNDDNKTLSQVLAKLPDTQANVVHVDEYAALAELELRDWFGALVARARATLIAIVRTCTSYDDTKAHLDEFALSIDCVFISVDSLHQGVSAALAVCYGKTKLNNVNVPHTR